MNYAPESARVSYSLGMDVDVVKEIEALSEHYEKWANQIGFYIGCSEKAFERLEAGEIDIPEYLKLSRAIRERWKPLLDEMGRVRADLNTRVKPALRELIRKAEAKAREMKVKSNTCLGIL